MIEFISNLAGVGGGCGGNSGKLPSQFLHKAYNKIRNGKILMNASFALLAFSHTPNSFMDSQVETITMIRRTFVGKVMSLLFICCLGWS